MFLRGSFPLCGYPGDWIDISIYNSLVPLITNWISVWSKNCLLYSSVPFTALLFPNYTFIHCVPIKRFKSKSKFNCPLNQVGDKKIIKHTFILCFIFTYVPLLELCFFIWIQVTVWCPFASAWRIPFISY